MKLVNFAVDRSVRLGAIVDGQVLDITGVAGSISGGIPSSIEQALGYWDTAVGDIQKSLNLIMSDKSTLQKMARKMKEVRFLPPVRAPGKILCVFVNYRSHGKEIGSAPSEPYFFFKHSGCIVGDGDDVIAPRFSTKVDHEVELGVIIGRKGKDIEQKDAYDFVAGYTVINDMSFRDGMKRGVEGTVVGRNLYKGKVADTSLPMGPFLVTRDEVPSPYPLRLSLKVNGEVRQEGTTDEMIFRIPDLVACASEGNTLLPGDVIATGTCSGVALYTGKYLQDGDWMEAEVEKVGVLRNKIRLQSRGV